jgi:hypothetical protein
MSFLRAGAGGRPVIWRVERVGERLGIFNQNALNFVVLSCRKLRDVMAARIISALATAPRRLRWTHLNESRSR